MLPMNIIPNSILWKEVSAKETFQAVHQFPQTLRPNLRAMKLNYKGKIA
jgi:hypothetical protein